MQIEIDNSTGEILVGQLRVKSFRMYRHNGTSPAWKQWVKDVADANGVSLPYNKKDFNKAASDMLKRAPTKAYEHFKKLSYKHFVVPHRDILVKIAYSRGGINVPVLRQIIKHKDVLQETYNDGLHHLLPIVAKTGKSPADLKRELGPKWKLLAKNSLNKNKALTYEYPVESLAKLCDKPTTILNTMRGYVRDRYFDEHLENFITHSALHMKGCWSDAKKMRNAFTIFRDAGRMALQLNLKIDPKWSPRRVKEEHDKMSQEINARKYPATAYASVSDIPYKVIAEGDYTAVLLESGFDIAEEGTHMGHCVGGYASYVAEGEYLVYSVRKNGERSSTIGIWIEKAQTNVLDKFDVPCVYKFNQHYARFNRRVECDVEKSIPNKILALLNKKDVQ